MSSKQKYVIATDLDRTLLPNGKQEYDNTMPIFSKIIKDKGIELVYVTGRNLKLVNEAVEQYNIPVPDYIVAQVGTTVLYGKEDKFLEDKYWAKYLLYSIKKWNIDNFKEELSVIKGLRIQEKDKQTGLKLSYYINDMEKSDLIVKEATKIIKSICKDATIVYSVDETHNIGLLDILPKTSKLTGLEYLRKKLKLNKEEIIYCGDSGNDILPLTFGYNSILVRNAIEEVKNTVKELSIQKDILDKLYITEGYKRLNGYYVSGIIEGLIKFGVISYKELKFK